MFGLGRQKPRHYRDMLTIVRESMEPDYNTTVTMRVDADTEITAGAAGGPA